MTASLTFPYKEEICQYDYKVHHYWSYPVTVMASVSHKYFSDTKYHPHPHTRTDRHEHTGECAYTLLHLNTKHMPRAGGTHHLPFCFSLQRLMSLTLECSPAWECRFYLSDVCVLKYRLVCLCVTIFVSSAIQEWLNKRLLNINLFPLHLAG